LGYLSDVAIVTVCQHPTFLMPLLRMDLWSILVVTLRNANRLPHHLSPSNLDTTRQLELELDELELELDGLEGALLLYLMKP